MKKSEEDKEALRKAVAELEPDQPVYFLRTLDEWVAFIRWSDRFLAGMFVTLALIAGCCIMAGTGESHKTEVGLLAAQMCQLKMLIGIVSTLLVSGVLHMIARLHWPTALIADKPAATQVMEFSEVMGLYWGATFSLLIATFYIPAAWSLTKRAEAVIAEDPGQTGAMDMHEWLQKHSMSLSPLQQLPQLIAMLAPLLVGPVDATLQRL